MHLPHDDFLQQNRIAHVHQAVQIDITDDTRQNRLKFALAILATDTDPALIGGFGYRSSRDADKFAGVS